MASKIYVSQNVFNNIKNELPTSVDMTKFCVNDITSNYSFKLYFYNSSNSKYYYTTMLKYDFTDDWFYTKFVQSNTPPGNCYNYSQSFEVTTTSNLYDTVEITHDYLYHPKFDSILTIFFIITILFIYFPYRIFSRAFGRWLKL